MSFGQSVVHQRAGEELTVVVVDQLFPHSLAEALGNASVNLSVDQHGIDYVAAIVHSDVFIDFDFAGFGVHFDGTNVTTEGEGEIRRLEEMGGFHAGLKSWRNVASRIGSEYEIAERDGLLSAVGGEAAAANGDVSRLHAEQVGSKRRHFGFELLCRHVSGSSSDSGGTAAEGPNAVWDSHGVAVHHVDILRIDSQFVGNELREGSFLALAMRRGAG